MIWCHENIQKIRWYGGWKRQRKFVARKNHQNMLCFKKWCCKLCAFRGKISQNNTIWGTVWNMKSTHLRDVWQPEITTVELDGRVSWSKVSWVFPTAAILSWKERDFMVHHLGVCLVRKPLQGKLSIILQDFVTCILWHLFEQVAQSIPSTACGSSDLVRHKLWGTPPDRWGKATQPISSVHIHPAGSEIARVGVQFNLKN